MKTLHDIYKEGVEELPNLENSFRADGALTEMYGKELSDDFFQDLGAHFKTTFLNFIDAEIEALLSVKVGATKLSKENQLFLSEVNGFKAFKKGYNHALRDRITALKEQRELIKKEV